MGRFRMAWRALRAAPLTSAAAVTLIAVGVGANSAVFAVTYQLLLKPLPYVDPSRLLIVSIAAPDGGEFGLPLADFEQLRTRLRTTEALAAYTTSEVPLRGSAEPRVIEAAYVTDEFFDVLAVSASRGQARGSGRSDPVVALSERASRMASIRLALGASRGRVVSMMLRRAASMTGLGIAMGLAGTTLVAGGLRGLLYGVGPQDPLTLAAVVSFVCVVAVGAAVLPARQASHADPQELLRSE